MSFFDEVDSLGIVEQHIKEVLKLEDDEANKLLKRYREVRTELSDRLDRVPTDTFTAQQLRGVLAQVDGAIFAMTSSLQTGIKDSAFKSAMKGIEHQIKEIKVFSDKFLGAVVPINLNAQLIAQDTNNFLINRYDASLKAYGEDLRGSITQVLSNEALIQSPYATVIRKLRLFFSGEEWKLHRIARTELHNVYNLGKMDGMAEVKDQVLPDLMKTLIHPMDNRTGADSMYAAKLDLIAPIDEPFKYRWQGKWRIYMAPPDRPNDRSILVPYRQVWDK